MKTLVILAGGKSTRMGKDKIFLEISKGVTFIEHLYRNALLFFDQAVISAGSSEHGKRIADLLPEAEIVPDRYEGIGPMGGIVSVFKQKNISSFAVIPADVPAADLRVLSFLYDQCGDEACLLKIGDLPEPLIAAYGKNTLCRMEQMAEDGSYRLRGALSDAAVFFTPEQIKERLPELSELDFEKSFFNINTEQEYLSRGFTRE